jgi:hypothetical protein
MLAVEWPAGSAHKWESGKVMPWERQAVDDEIAEAVKKERRACLRIALAHSEKKCKESTRHYCSHGLDIAIAIRARSKPA